jgi:hypothetical protein
MIDDRFAASEFKKLGRTTAGADNLHKELQREIAGELHRTIEPAFRAIAGRLRELGHQVNEAPAEFDPEFASWDYEHREGDGWMDLAFRIWLHTQVGVYSGYNEKPYDGDTDA